MIFSAVIISELLEVRNISTVEKLLYNTRIEKKVMKKRLLHRSLLGIITAAASPSRTNISAEPADMNSICVNNGHIFMNLRIRTGTAGFSAVSELPPG